MEADAVKRPSASCTRGGVPDYVVKSHRRNQQARKGYTLETGVTKCSGKAAGCRLFDEAEGNTPERTEAALLQWGCHTVRPTFAVCLLACFHVLANFSLY